MSSIVEASVELKNEKLMFECCAGENPAIITDYIPPLGDGKGYMPLQLFLISLATCLGGVIAPILRKMSKHIEGLSIQAKGYRRAEHPTGFEKVELAIDVKSPDVTGDDMKKVIGMAEDKYCPIWGMIKNNVEVVTTYTIHV